MEYNVENEEEYLIFFGKLKSEYLGYDLGEYEGTWVNGTIPYNTCEYGSGVVKYEIRDRSNHRTVGTPEPETKVIVEEKESKMMDGDVYFSELDAGIDVEYFTRV